jgi:hypothetical protein
MVGYIGTSTAPSCSTPRFEYIPLGAIGSYDSYLVISFHAQLEQGEAHLIADADDIISGVFRPCAVFLPAKSVMLRKLCLLVVYNVRIIWCNRS